MKILIIGNLSDKRCGFANYTQQMITALQRSGLVEVGVFDGTYEQVYQRREAQVDPFFPEDLATYDVVHLIWHAMTMNHYSGADWGKLPALGVLRSWYDGGPSDASCPFEDQQDLKWSDYPKPGFVHQDYPVPDWVEDLPAPASTFTVGASSVRGDGVSLIREVCERRGWAMNLPTPGVWVSLEDEIRRLARSTVNVCWYRTPPLWKNRASAPSMLLAAGRPIVVNTDHLLEHLWWRPDLYHGVWEDGVEEVLATVHYDWQRHNLLIPTTTRTSLSWSRAAAQLIDVWSTSFARTFGGAHV